MLKKLKIKILILLISIIIIGYFLISSLIGNSTFYNFKLLFNHEQKQFIKKYFLPYKTISQRDEIISQRDEQISQRDKEKFELSFKEREPTDSTVVEALKESGKDLSKVELDYATNLSGTYFNFRKASIYGGSNEIQRNIIAKMVLGL